MDPNELSLMPFQEKGVAFLCARDRALLADSMGLGKSCQAITAVARRGAYPCLIICPASVKLNWAREIGMWDPGADVGVMAGRKSKMPNTQYVVINYDILIPHIPAIRAKGFRSVVFDELHYVKNGKAKRTKAAIAIARGIPIKYGLTGTPILNRPAELPSQLKTLGLLDPFGNEYKFKERYCAPKQVWTGRKYVKDYTGASNLNELNYRLFKSGLAIRRHKRDVLPELPETIVSGIPVNIKASKEILKLEEHIERELIEKGIMGEKSPNRRQAMAEAIQKGGIGAVAELRKKLAMAKLPFIKRWISDFLEGCDEKLIVFGWHVDVIKELMQEFPGQAAIYGSVPQATRQAEVDRFQKDPECRLFFGNIQAAGVGITLTAASKLLFTEIAWGPGDLEQAQDRANRIGQTADSVIAYYMIALGTLEEDMLDVVNKKKGIIDTALGG